MAKSRKGPPDEARIRMIACAQLSSQGFTQNDIALRIHSSQPEVSRLLDKAAAANLLRIQPTFLEQNVTEEELALALELCDDQSAELETKARQLVPRGLYFRLHTVSAKDLQAFCDQAARHVAGLLGAGDLTVGTMWGSTIDQIIEGVTRYARPSRKSDLRAIPLAGDPLYLLNQENQAYSASALSAKLERAFTGRTRSDLPSLTGVPAYISRQLMSDQRKAEVLYDFIRAIPGYNRIFGEAGYVQKIDTVLTGVGVFAPSPRQTTATFLREREAQEGAEFQRLRKSILGDFAGWILPKPGLAARDKLLVGTFNQGWTGISIEQLTRIAIRAKTGSPPGVIVVAFGSENKAGILRESLQRGLVNHLVVDEDLAKELTKSTSDD